MSTISSRSLLIVHGRDFKPAKDILLDISTSALRSGVERDYPDFVDALDNVHKDIAYYGDLTNALLEAHGKRYDETLDVGDRANALANLRSISARKRFGIRQYDCLPGKTALREFAADIAAPAMRAVGLAMPLIACVSKDCAEYLNGDSDYADKVRERVRSRLCQLFERGDQILLLSHGLGCVAAYDVLWQLSHEPEFRERYGECKVDTWVTVGAPLGDNSIRKRLLGAKCKVSDRFPTNVISWHNVSAEDDYSCHDNTLADDFKKMMDRRLVSVVKDYLVYNLAVRYGKSNPHSSVGYYIHPRVTKILVDWMRTDRVQEIPKYTF
ncbi:MAG: hypothetical protein OEM60_00610 [Gammaproteobacteria bacterium]|nr:hypothetical protein [Gammaproteobacteria bacterium]MDH3430862.1 hypothetical protein [Gammaproteobacteria bacterium]MDH3432332.1 hypothetical protein [Gammaproteobacteria bacterium]